jgi:DNA uptake protein ComE-like DNA-binding protein
VAVLQDMDTRLRPALAALGLALALARLDRPVRTLGEPLACERAQVIDGELRCDDELLTDVRELCGGHESHRLGVGDEVRHACTWMSVARMPPEQLAALEQPVDLNAASPEELASLPGVGPTIAGRIVAGRPYASVDELLDVEGIGPKRLAAIRPRARLGP